MRFRMSWGFTRRREVLLSKQENATSRLCDQNNESEPQASKHQPYENMKHALAIPVPFPFHPQALHLLQVVIPLLSDRETGRKAFSSGAMSILGELCSFQQAASFSNAKLVPKSISRLKWNVHLVLYLLMDVGQAKLIRQQMVQHNRWLKLHRCTSTI